MRHVFTDMICELTTNVLIKNMHSPPNCIMHQTVLCNSVHCSNLSHVVRRWCWSSRILIYSLSHIHTHTPSHTHIHTLPPSLPGWWHWLRYLLHQQPGGVSLHCWQLLGERHLCWEQEAAGQDPPGRSVSVGWVGVVAWNYSGHFRHKYWP